VAQGENKRGAALLFYKDGFEINILRNEEVDNRKNFIITLEKEWRWKAKVSQKKKEGGPLPGGNPRQEKANLSKGSDAKLRV
jgi:hypothetical protein